MLVWRWARLGVPTKRGNTARGIDGAEGHTPDCRSIHRCGCKRRSALRSVVAKLAHKCSLDPSGCRKSRIHASVPWIRSTRVKAQARIVMFSLVFTLY